MQTTTVISLGGSLIAPDKVDQKFIIGFYSLLAVRMDDDALRRFVIVTGGGAPAREYQQAFKEVYNISGGDELKRNDSSDWIGIAATRLNAEFVRQMFEKYCKNPIVDDPTTIENFTGQVLVASGWKPGRSTDYVAVALAERFKADKVINLTNIAQVYTDDPRANLNAQPLENIAWDVYRSIIGNEWSPGKHAPFDPIASKFAEENGLVVIIAKGSDQESDLENLKRILDGRKFFGTTIHP